MERVISVFGNLVASAGILLCLFSAVARMVDFYLIYGYSAITLFQTGTGLMVLACLCKLELVLLRLR